MITVINKNIGNQQGTHIRHISNRRSDITANKVAQQGKANVLSLLIQQSFVRTFLSVLISTRSFFSLLLLTTIYQYLHNGVKQYGYR